MRQFVLNPNRRLIGHALRHQIVFTRMGLNNETSVRSSTLVVCEATGSYEYVLVDACHLAGIAIRIANPRQVRDFAKGHGVLEKLWCVAVCRYWGTCPRSKIGWAKPKIRSHWT